MPKNSNIDSRYFLWSKKMMMMVGETSTLIFQYEDQGLLNLCSHRSKIEHFQNGELWNEK